VRHRCALAIAKTAAARFPGGRCAFQDGCQLLESLLGEMGVLGTAGGGAARARENFFWPKSTQIAFFCRGRQSWRPESEKFLHCRGVQKRGFWV
jgi:hypothetical protein